MIHNFNFSIARLPRIEFGAGCINKLPGIINRYGRRILLITGGQSFIETENWQRLSNMLTNESISYDICQIGHEPSPQLIDDIVQQYHQQPIDVVVAIGGGSPLDAGKAIAGLLRIGDSVMDYLEGVGPERQYQGPAVPFIAVPTTAGTGSEATKNAVLSKQSKQGFKKSFRDDQLVAGYALIDPDLLASCPAELIAANGMDALTQLIESYVSSRANVMNDALAISGIAAARDSLLAWYQGENTAENRQNMAYASMLSGINLAQTGLGSVHGLASPLGAFYPIPHGVVCGTLVATATDVNIRAMQEREPDNVAIAKYARLGNLMRGHHHASQQDSLDALVTLLEHWTQEMKLPRLSTFGINESELDHVVQHSRGSSMKTNPVVLTDAEIKTILIQRL